MPTPITKFRDKYKWLSNFSPSPVMYEGDEYPTVENAFQAAKTDRESRHRFTYCDPGEAKLLGRHVTLREDWDEVKVDIMRELIHQKFRDKELAIKLTQTGEAKLIEVNTWGDIFWGKYKAPGDNFPQGKNQLGEILEEQRDWLKKAMKY